MDWKKLGSKAPIILLPGGLAVLFLWAIAQTETGKDAIEGVQALIAQNIFPNNNPGNLRPLPNGQQWDGQVGVSKKNFVIFESVEKGLRAMGIQALSYQYSHGITNLADFGDRWAPPASIGGDNDSQVGEYGAQLASSLGVNLSDNFDLASGVPFTLARLMKAIVRNENGIKNQLVPDSYYQQYAQIALTAKGFTGEDLA